MVEELERLEKFEKDYHKVRNDIDILVSYDYSEEEENFNENDKPENHVFSSKVVVETFINKYEDKK